MTARGAIMTARCCHNPCSRENDCMSAPVFCLTGVAPLAKIKVSFVSSSSIVAKIWLALHLRGRYQAAIFESKFLCRSSHMARVTVEDCIDKVENRFDLG